MAERIQALTVGEGEARAVVELFGWRLQNVSLQSLSVARQIRAQYGGLVAPALLARWAAHPATAPGRELSSPWPDHIEIDTLTFHGSSACTVSAHLVMMSSLEVANGGAAAKIPVRLELSRVTGQWLITGYAQGQLAAVASPTVSARQAAAEAAIAYLQARTQTLVRGARQETLRRRCAPDSRLADEVLWWAAGTRASARGREIGVPPLGYPSASLNVSVRRVSLDLASGRAHVLAYTAPGLGDSRLVESEPAFHLVALVRGSDGRWLAEADASTTYDPDLPTYLRAGGAPAAVVAAAREQVRRARDPGAPVPASLVPLRAFCAAMNARDPTALRAVFTADSAIGSESKAQIRADYFTSTTPPHRRSWRMAGFKLLGAQLDGLACGWVSYRYVSDWVANIPGGRGYATFVFLERQPNSRWLIFAPPE